MSINNNKEKNKNPHIGKALTKVSALLFVIYLIIALYFLWFARETVSEYSYNLTLFKEIRRYTSWAENSELGFRMMLYNVVGNVVCFIPNGFLLPLVFKRIKNGVAVTLITFGFSLIIELFQLLFKLGSFDVDDLFLNTLGGLIGYIIYYIFRRIYTGRRRRQ